MTTTSKSLIELLETERRAFDDDAYPLPKHQIDRFRSCCELLVEDDDSLRKRSKQRRSCRAKVKTLLGDVFLSVGPEVFLLCTIAATISTLGQVVLSHLVPDLRRWWNAVAHPTGLTKTANTLCKIHSISRQAWADRHPFDGFEGKSHHLFRRIILSAAGRADHPTPETYSPKRRRTTEAEQASQPIVSSNGATSALSSGSKVDLEHHPREEPRTSKDANYAAIHSTILPLTVQGVEVILAKLKDGKEDGMTMTFPHRSGWLPFITIPYETCVEIMQQYTVENGC